MSLHIQNIGFESGRHSYCWRYNCDSRRDIRPNPFFRRPHININDLKANPVYNMTLTSNGDRPEIFDVNVWTVRVKNKKYGPLSRNASKCRVELTLLKNGRDYDNTFRVPWNDESLPITSNYRSSLGSRDEYRSKLPFCYVGSLIRDVSNPILLVGQERDIVIGCTFRELDSLYIVSQKPLGENNMISVPLDGSDSYDILLKFYSDEYRDTHGKQFKLKAFSWDDVKLTKV